MSEMFEGLSPEVAALLDAAAADLPAAQADAGLLAAMAAAVSTGPIAAPTPTPRRKSVLGKVLTAKVAAIAGVLVLSGGVASAATGTLPDPAQDVAHDAANVVGLDIPESNHGKTVSSVARDKSNDGEGNHGATVCAVASEGKCKSGDDDSDDDEPDSGNSADHRKDGEHRNENSVKTTTTTTVDDDSGDDEADENEPASEQGKDKGKSGEHKPDSSDDD